MNTIIVEKNENGDDVYYDVFSKLIESRIVFLFGTIDDSLATDIVATLMHLDAQNDHDPISLYINSDVSDFRAAMMVYDTLKLLHSEVRTYCLGAASSEIALILAAGAKGHRYASENAVISLAQLSHEGSRYGDLKNAEIALAQSKKDNDMFLSALALETGRSVKSVSKDIEHLRFMTANEAVKFGVIDGVIGDDGKKNAKAK
jgi:ATP-dependent Clp protease protease subunit